ncbi:hypothetical protein LQZ18_12215 [Lachnospiraceae bacterium ZAX-1]
MKDYIDERNRREKMASSIVKRSNVMLMTQEEIAWQNQQKANAEKATDSNTEERNTPDLIWEFLKHDTQANRAMKSLREEAMSIQLTQQEIEGLLGEQKKG